VKDCIVESSLSGHFWPLYIYRLGIVVFIFHEASQIVTKAEIVFLRHKHLSMSFKLSNLIHIREQPRTGKQNYFLI